MANRPETYVALLRGINVSGQHTMPMATLRSICTGLRCESVRTYIQSGNVVLTSSLPAEALEKRLEQAIEKTFGFSIPVIARPASSWTRYIGSNPFSSEATKEGNRVVLCVSKSAPKATAASDLQQRASHGERVVRKGDAIWIHYANGIGRSTLTPAVLDRSVGSPVTARNWRTVLKLADMVRDAASG